MPGVAALFQWLHARLFSSWPSTFASLGILYLLWLASPAADRLGVYPGGLVSGERKSLS